MYERSQVLARILASVTAERKKRRARTLKTDRTLQQLVADLVAARRAAAMTQEEVAARMWTTKSVVSRLESGKCTRPTLSTIEKYADAVGALVEIRVRPYYLYQCDLVEGAGHFRTPVGKGLEIIEGLRGHTSGYAVPQYIVDAPGEDHLLTQA